MSPDVSRNFIPLHIFSCRHDGMQASAPADPMPASRVGVWRGKLRHMLLLAEPRALHPANAEGDRAISLGRSRQRRLA